MSGKSTIISALEGLQAFRGDYVPEQKRDIENLYYQVFKERFVPTSCSNCYHDAVDKMWAYIRRTGDVMPEREFILKYGAVINVGNFGEGKFYIRHTLTDALAIEYLRKHPHKITEFEKYPADWQMRISTKEPNKSTSTNKPIRRKVKKK